MSQKLDYETRKSPGDPSDEQFWYRLKCKVTILNLARAFLLLVMGASGFYSWLVWDAMSEAVSSLGKLVTLFEYSIAVLSISTICFCVTFISRRRKKTD